MTANFKGSKSFILKLKHIYRALTIYLLIPTAMAIRYINIKLIVTCNKRYNNNWYFTMQDNNQQ